MLSYEYYKFSNHLLLVITEMNNRQELQVLSEEDELLDSLSLPSESKLKKVQMTKNGKLVFGLKNLCRFFIFYE